jgi:GT2 family glycosyltransferase
VQSCEEAGSLPGIGGFQVSERFDLASHTIILESPRRLTTASAWTEHIPFAMLLVDIVCPGTIVELGTHAGDSYCAFCQAVESLGVQARCFAVDTWKGDPHAGEYGPEVLADLREHHDHQYGQFSSLIQATFDEAVGQFEDGSIDILHIDGYHTYEAVKHDFTTWLPKVSRRGVVLFHDTNVRTGGFGIWRFWAEVTQQYPHFEFAHGHGLGVLSVGIEEPPALRAFREQFAMEGWISTLFFELAQRLSLQVDARRAHQAAEEAVLGKDRDIRELQGGIRQQQEALAAKDEALAARQVALDEKDVKLSAQEAALDEQQAIVLTQEGILERKDADLALRDSALEEKEAAIAERDAIIAAGNAQLAAVKAELDQICQRAGYRALEKTIRQVDRVAPWYTRRRQIFLAGSKVARVMLSEGAGGVAKRLPMVRQWGPELLTVARLPQPEPAVPPALPPGQEPSLSDEYQAWRHHHSPSWASLEAQRAAARDFAYTPKISIVMPVFNTKPEWLIEAVESVRAQTYANWELCIVDDASNDPATRKALRHYAFTRRIHRARLGENSGIAAASNRALSMATGEFVGFLDHDDELKPNALFEIVKLLNRRRDLDFIYTDEDKRELDGRLSDPFFKPDWSPDLFLTTNYVTHFAVYRKELVDQLGRLRKGYDGSQDHDLALRVSETTDRIGHIPLPLYTWRKVPGSAAGSAEAKPWAYRAGAKALQDSLRRRGLEGDVMPGLWKGSHRVRYRIAGQPTVGIIIPTRDRVDLLRRCIQSIEELSSYKHYEVIVVDNDSTDEATMEFLSTLKGRVIDYPGPFDFASMMNIAAAEARTDMLLFLNNDTEVITPGWIEAMLEYAQQPQVGAVGARLLYPQGHPQHEGIIMGLGLGTAGNVDHGGYFSLGQSVLNASAVTAACMMTRSAVFSELGGFEKRLTVAFNDVDYCLRVRQAGYRVVYTPYAELLHYESASRGSLHPPADEAFFRERWGCPGEIVDPYYNPNLDLRRPFRVRVDADAGPPDAIPADG